MTLFDRYMAVDWSAANTPLNVQLVALNWLEPPALFVAQLTVPVGATVVWVNNGPTIHNVAADDLSWSSPILQQGETYSIVFNAPGTYPVLCSIHPEMRGTVTVQ